MFSKALILYTSSLEEGDNISQSEKTAGKGECDSCS
jgi:hypothetical protein